MKIQKGYRFKLKPTRDQEARFRQFAGAVRWVWNQMLAQRRQAYHKTGKSPSGVEQMALLPKLKAHKETAWLAQVHSQVLQDPIKNLDRAFDSFFQKKSGYPRFKSRKTSTPSFSYPQGVKVEEHRVYLPKIGWVRFRQSQEVEGVIKRATVKKAASRWFVSLQVEMCVSQPPQVVPDPDTSVGLDLGLTYFLVTSSGEEIEAPRYFRKAEEKLAQEQRRLSRKQKGSHRRTKQRERLSRLHEKVSNARRDFLHKLSHRLVRENQVVIVEDLHVKGLARSRLSKSIHDAAWGEFRRQLAYKALWQGKVFHSVDRFFPSTRLHWDCRTLNEVSLSDRVFACEGCGMVLHRDHNAAHNIKQKGLLDLLAAGQADRVNARGPGVRLAKASSLG